METVNQERGVIRDIPGCGDFVNRIGALRDTASGLAAPQGERLIR